MDMLAGKTFGVSVAAFWIGFIVVLFGSLLTSPFLNTLGLWLAIGAVVGAGGSFIIAIIAMFEGLMRRC